MIRLKEIYLCLGLVEECEDVFFDHLVCDTRLAGQNDLFIAVPGETLSSQQVLDKAVEKKISFIIAPHPDPTPRPHVVTRALENEGAPIIQTILYVPNIQKTLLDLCDLFYPHRPDHLVAVTGTNGKTSTTHLLWQLWTLGNISSGCIGTMGVFSTPCFQETFSFYPLTTPPLTLMRRILHTYHQQNACSVAFEATSHALSQQRLKGILADVAVFTSFSQDHMDYHKTMGAYLEAKKQLFIHHLKPGAKAILNKDIPCLPSLVELCQQNRIPYKIYGARKPNQPVFHGALDHGEYEVLFCTEKGQQVRFYLAGQVWEVFVPLIGTFQVENLLAALMVLEELSHDVGLFLDLIPTLKTIPGRMEYAGNKNGGSIFIDYAHSPHALEKALQDLRLHASGKIGVVFGCGGNRDQEKRLIMGQIAHRCADWTIITDDNPRYECPQHIRSQILQGCPNGQECPSREKAIAWGVQKLEPGDILLIAGKGHENVQIIGTEKVFFSDIQCVQNFL